MSSLLEVRDLTIRFPAARGSRSSLPAETAPRASFAAVRDLSFSINSGEVLGLVGESGSGKSLTSLAIMGLLPPSATVSGSITFQNVASSPIDLTTLDPEKLRHLRGSRIAMIFQEPMTALNPVMRVGDQIAEAVLAHNAFPPEILDKAWCQARDGNRDLLNEWFKPMRLRLRMLQILVLRRGVFFPPRIRPEKAYELTIQAMRDVAIPEPEARARSYPHQLSGGMRQRVMIAMAIVNRPQLLIADEPTTALDVTIQQQILDLLNELRQKFSLSMLFISHDLAVVSHVADRVAVMYAGSLVELAPKSAIFSAPAHPYTRGLLRAIPTLATNRTEPLATIQGTVPPIAVRPPGCPFEPRCGYRIPACAHEFPSLVEVAPGHFSRCPVVGRSAPGAAR